MKLASLKHGRDGKLVVVSDDLAWYADASHICATMQAALDDWDQIAPHLQLLAIDLRNEAGAAPAPSSMVLPPDGPSIDDDAAPLLVLSDAVGATPAEELQI